MAWYLAPMVPAALLSLSLQTLPVIQPSQQGSVKRDVSVGRVEVDAYVVDPKGNPIPDLLPSDFRVLVHGKPVRVESAEWVPADRPEAPPALEPEDDKATETTRQPLVLTPPGRLLVFLFQTHYERWRLPGLIRMAHEAVRYLDRMLPTDRVAVLSYDSRLKLRQDFTDDHERLRRAIFDCLKFGLPGKAEESPFPSLAARWDYAAAKDAASVDRGLSVLARALEPLPGAKALFFFGWGLRIDRSPRETRDLETAIADLYAARTNMFMLDVSDADFHTLEIQLQAAADLTGGSYQKTHLFPQAAFDRVARSIAGRYVLVFEKPDYPGGAHPIDVELVGRKGRVMARTLYVD